jgi:hypothetical protein
LEKDFGIKTVAEAEKEVVKLEKESKKRKEIITTEYNKLKEQYDW